MQPDKAFIASTLTLWSGVRSGTDKVSYAIRTFALVMYLGSILPLQFHFCWCALAVLLGYFRMENDLQLERLEEVLVITEQSLEAQ